MAVFTTMRGRLLGSCQGLSSSTGALGPVDDYRIIFCPSLLREGSSSEIRFRTVWIELIVVFVDTLLLFTYDTVS